MNGSGAYDGVGGILTQDHAWRLASPLVDTPAGTFPHVANERQVIFVHNLQFTDVDQWPLGTYNPPHDTGLSAQIRLNGASLSAYKGRLMQLRVQEQESGHTVGVYRVPQIPDGDIVARLVGVLDIGVDYFVVIYIDANGNGQYDNPAAASASPDLGFSIAVKSAMPITMADGGATDDGGEDGAGSTGGEQGDAGCGGLVLTDNTSGVDSGVTCEPYLWGIDMDFDLLTTSYQGNVDVGEP
jgi:hypothetical protein